MPPRLIVCAVLAASLAAGQDRAGEWQPLFDGKSQQGWQDTAFRDHGEAHADKGTLILEPGKPLTGMTWSGAFPKTGYEDPERTGMSAEDIAEQPAWSREQERLKSLSPQSWRVIARGAGHAVSDDKPDIVVQEVKRLIDYLQSGRAPPFGSTKTE